MSNFQPPITIDLAMKYIKNNEYLLPAFQRDFVWSTKQIEMLFDSLMKNYPTSSMLFWKVKGETKTKWKFYKFINSFILNAANKQIINQLFEQASGSNDFHAVLDGQQRLTAMRIGLYGTYSYHEPRKTWEYTENSFPTRRMYLNISKTGGIDDDCEYFFEFKKDSETNQNDFYIDSDNNKWFKVSKIVDYNNSGDDAGDYFADQNLTKDQKRIINKLKYTIYTNPTITYYEEDEQNPDKAVKIFTRINSGGTPLDFSEIVFSLIVSNWEKQDAKTKIKGLLQSVEQKGFSIDINYIVKSFLYLFHRSVKTEISSFTKDFCLKLENNWDKIESCILSVYDLMKTFGLTSQTLTSNNATLPILYYLFHKNIYQDYSSLVQYNDERQLIKQWLLSSIIRRTFGSTSDSTLQQTRKVFTDDINLKYINDNYVFNGNEINKNIKNLGGVDEESIDEILLTQKDDRYAFSILSILYPNLDYKNNNFHKDHLYAETLYDKLSDELKSKIPFKIYNSIINLQMLDSNENKSKNSKPLDIWVEEECKERDKKQFLNNHLIPENISLELSNVEEFLEMRKKLLKSKLIDLLNCKQVKTQNI